MELSVIIPVFNEEKYLERCLNSVFDQKFSGTFEVIAVDDASTDNSLKILRNYKMKEKRLTVIAHDKNKTQAIARSTGMKIAKGDYIMHIDSDDWLLPDAFEKLYIKCMETNADVLVYNFLINEEGEFFRANHIKEDLITTNKELVQRLFFGGTFNKVVKRELVKNMISGKVGVSTTEDLLYGIEILLRANLICLVPEYYYVYFRHANSITVTIDPEQNLRNQLVILKQLFKISNVYGLDKNILINILDYLEYWLSFILSQLQDRGLLNRNENLEIIAQILKIPIVTKSIKDRLEIVLKEI